MSMQPVETQRGADGMLPGGIKGGLMWDWRSSILRLQG